MNDRTRGLYRKYDVQRLDDKKGKHKNCEYYVLDLNHDKFAAPALRAYAEHCKREYPELAKDLCAIADEVDERMLQKEIERG